MAPEEASTEVEKATKIVPESGSEEITVVPSLTARNLTQNFTIIPPKSSSPTITNRASAIKPSDPQIAKETAHHSPILPQPSVDPLRFPPTSPSPVTNNRTAPPSLVEKIRASEDKTLKRLAPVTISTTGRPRILIPDEVFQQGKKLEIHNNPPHRSTIVRIPSEYLRQKILEKSIWYVGDSMFHTAQWSSEHSKSTHPLKAIKIWAHLTGVPLDLRHQKGLSLVTGLVGEPKETDDFTKNLVSLTVSHVKVEVDLTKPLPSVVEFERQSGEVVEVLVHYPWTPPTCTHCHELGHIIRNCLHYTPPAPSTQKDTGAKTPASQGSKTGPRLYKKKVPGPNPQPTNPLFIPQPSIAFRPLPLNPQNPTSSSSLLQKTPTLSPPSASSP
ncbi:hypothetical protein F2Q69_00049719 [Brassica cretica]|uniref:DUF4283 domain-containing protein n=1 Tax=Brassica cretica TaxID=69181 RepID=A0A8S9Q8B6_BRACR|nr:hypothetical protein F2Q69_00049719 [Brassica cretica]